MKRDRLGAAEDRPWVRSYHDLRMSAVENVESNNKAMTVWSQKKGTRWLMLPGYYRKN
jgi:hypothetical protein